MISYDPKLYAPVATRLLAGPGNDPLNPHRSGRSTGRDPRSHGRQTAYSVARTAVSGSNRSEGVGCQCRLATRI